MQVPPEDADAICSLVRGPCDEQVLAGLSHILRPDPESKGPRGYRKALKEPASLLVLKAITEWVEKQINQALPSIAEDGGNGR